VEFVKSLRAEHLQSFWYSASKYNFALVATFISLLWVTARTQEEAHTCKLKLEEYRWILRLSSKSADFLERAISMLASSTGVLVKAIPNKPSESDSSEYGQPITADSTPTRETQTYAEQQYDQPTPTSTDYASENMWYGNAEAISISDFSTNFRDDAQLGPTFVESEPSFLFHNHYSQPPG
jgi:hypothetical protein